MRVALIAGLAGCAAVVNAQVPSYDVEVYYSFFGADRNDAGVIAGASRRFLWGNGVAAVIDAEGVVHELDDESMLDSDMQFLTESGLAFGVGWSQSLDQLIVWDGAQMNLHAMPSDIHGDIEGGNDGGEVVLWARNYDLASEPTHGYVWKGSAWENLGTLRADQAAWAAVYPYAINESGVIVGSSTTDFTTQLGGLATHAFKYVPGEGMQSLGTLLGNSGNSVARHVNDRGDIVGSSWDEGSFASQATMWTAEGEIIRLSPDGTYQCVAEYITEDRTVFGWVEVIEPAFARHAFRWSKEDGFEDLGTTETFFLGFKDVNASGVAVGSDMTEVYEQHAVAYFPGEGLVQLSYAVADVDDVDHLLAGVSIQDDGSILAWGDHTGDQWPTTDRSVTLSPVCGADMNGDGGLDILDFVAFQDAFKAGEADCDGDGAHTILDFVCFQSLFGAGCE